LSATLIGRFTAAAGAGITVESAPLAEQSAAPTGVLFSFDKYSSANLLIDAVREDAVRDPTPANRQLLMIPHVNVTRILNDGTKATGIEVQANGQRQTISTARELKPNFKVLIASSTVHSTRLSLNSFPVNGMGANLMAHLRSNTTVTIPRSELGLGPPTQLETGMVLIRGSVPVTGGNHHFHLQVIAASNLASAPDSQVFTQIPDVDLLNDLIQAQSADTIVMVLRAVGELSGDQTMTPPDGPKNLSKSWVDLTKDPNNLEFGSTRRGWVNLVTNADDESVRLAMNKAAIDLAKNIANNPANVAALAERLDLVLLSAHIKMTQSRAPSWSTNYDQLDSVSSCLSARCAPLARATLAQDWPADYAGGGSGSGAQKMERLPLRCGLADGSVADRRAKPKFGPEQRLP
jgi:hypothetical protein